MTGDIPEPVDAAASASEREAMVREVEADVARFGDGVGGTTLQPKVRDALLKVPREAFVPAERRSEAYRNRPLPIGHGQTISQPLVVALMTQHLALSPQARVLDVGTGSGYQTALLAELAAEVVTVEIVAALAERAQRALEGLGYRNITCRTGDGSRAGADLGPYDAILVAAASRSVPESLVDQLQPGGRMVIPIGTTPVAQELVRIIKDDQGKVEKKSLFPVAFVPMTGKRA